MAETILTLEGLAAAQQAASDQLADAYKRIAVLEDESRDNGHRIHTLETGISESVGKHFAEHAKGHASNLPGPEQMGTLLLQAYAPHIEAFRKHTEDQINVWCSAAGAKVADLVTASAVELGARIEALAAKISGEVPAASPVVDSDSPPQTSLDAVPELSDLTKNQP